MYICVSVLLFLTMVLSTETSDNTRTGSTLCISPYNIYGKSDL